MSKNTPRVSSGSVGYAEGYVIFHDVPETLVGSILEIIEAIGLKDSQERAVKDIIRQKVYSIFYDRDPIYIKNDLHTMLREKYWAHKKKATADGVPVSYLTLEDIK
jgi:hypothetical protein